MTFLCINGRHISRAWLKRYFREHPEAIPPRLVRTHRRRKKKVYKPQVYARFFLPAIYGTGEEAETRCVGITTPVDVGWIQDMTDSYAALGKGLTTFFPDLP